MNSVFWGAVTANQLEVIDVLLGNDVFHYSAIIETEKEKAVNQILGARAWDTIKTLLGIKALDAKTKYAIIGWIAVNEPEKLSEMVDLVSEDPPRYPGNTTRLH